MHSHYREDSLFAPERKRSAAPIFVLILILVLIGGCVIYNLAFNTRPTLIRQSVTINDLPGGLEGFKILHISDLDGRLFGTGQENLLSAIGKEKYHAVCITGDFTNKQGNPKALIRLLNALSPDVPVFFIAGDEDPQTISAASDGTFTYSNYIRMLSDYGAIFLDAPQPVQRNSCTVWFSPEMFYTLDLQASKATAQKRTEELLQEEPSETRNTHLASTHYSLDRFSRMEEAMRSMTPGDIHIALSHVPLTNEGLRNLHDSYADGQSIYIDGVSLVLAGHYNAGQWRLPGSGALYVPSSSTLAHTGFFPSENGLVGVQSMMGITQYISPGLGTSRIYPFPISTCRLFNRPAVTLITLTSKLTAH